MLARIALKIGAGMNNIIVQPEAIALNDFPEPADIKIQIIKVFDAIDTAGKIDQYIKYNKPKHPNIIDREKTQNEM
jgi:hypothetical protein